MSPGSHFGHFIWVHTRHCLYLLIQDLDTRHINASTEYGDTSDYCLDLMPGGNLITTVLNYWLIFQSVNRFRCQSLIWSFSRFSFSDLHFRQTNQHLRNGLTCLWVFDCLQSSSEPHLTCYWRVSYCKMELVPEWPSVFLMQASNKSLLLVQVEACWWRLSMYEVRLKSEIFS